MLYGSVVYYYYMTTSTIALSYNAGSVLHALITITGVEVMHMIRKRQVPLISMKKSAQSARNFIHRLFDIPAPFFPTYMNRKSAF